MRHLTCLSLALLICGCENWTPDDTRILLGAVGRIVSHEPTRRVPYRWTEEAMIEAPGHSPRETLYHQGRVIPGAP